MDFTRKDPAVDLTTFLQCYGSALPITVKIVEGFFGTNAEDTLEVDQILVIYKVERQKMIVAIDQFNQELCVPQNSKSKVQLLPSGYHNEHSTIQELFTAYQTQYFRVLENIPSVEISSETTLMLLGSQPINNNLIKCQVIDLHGSREVLLPFQLSGRFQPLLDAREYFLDEVLAQYQLPVNVRFVSQSKANDSVCSRLLSHLGNIRLTNEIEVEMAFAASLDDNFSLNVFPKTLDIKVSCGFKVTAETSNKIKQCRQSLAANEKALKRLDSIKADYFYFTACPVRRFNLESLQLPSPSKPKKAENKTSKAKQRKQLEEPFINTALATKRDREQSASSSYCSSQDEEDYEIFEVEGILKIEMSKTEQKAADACPDLPPKVFRNARSSSTITHDVTQAKRSQVRCRPIPMPRKRLGTGKDGPKENINDPVDTLPKIQGDYIPETTGKSESSLQSRSSSKDDAEDTCPELPPRPEFLKARPPPPLPPRDPPCGEGLAYLVTDVTDWRAVEERASRTMRQRREMEKEALDTNNDDPYIEVIYGVYTEVKDDGRVFRQDDFRHLDLSLNYSLETEEVYVDMYDRQSSEMDETQPNLENFQEEDYLEPIEIRDFEDALTPQNGETEREGDATRHFERGGKENAISNDDIEKGEESPPRDQRKKNALSQKAARIDSPAKNSRRKQTQPCVVPTPHQAEVPSRQKHKSNIIISPRREDDFMDFELIDQHFKLMKQQREVQGKLAVLPKQVTGKEQTLTTTQSPPVGTASTSEHSGSQHAKKDPCDDTQNRLDSPRAFSNRSQRSTHVERPGLECLVCRERDDSVKNAEERRTSPSSPTSENTGPLKAKYDLEDYLNGAQERKEVNKSHSTVLDDDDSDNDDYEEFPDSHYINKGTNVSFEKLRDDGSTYNFNVEKERKTVSDSKDEEEIDGIYYNTVESETEGERAPCYLQLENPRKEEESVYVNVDAEEKDPENLKEKVLGIKDGKSQPVQTTHDLARSVCESGISGAPPLPPKKRSSSLPDI